MRFLDTVANAKNYLREHARVSLRALKREFNLDEDGLQELVEELVDVQQVAAREGKVLCWTGSAPAESPDPDPEARPAAVATPAPRAAPTTTPPPAPDSALPEGERRHLTVMFCDLVGSTPLGQRLDPEELHELVHAFQESCAKAVDRFEGRIATYMGDGMLVYFGYPQAHEDDPERAIRAGLAIMDAMEGLNDRLERKHGTRISARIGIHSGPVVVGGVGGAEASEKQILGHTMNLAARLEGIAETNSVAISGDTLRLVAGMFITKDLGARQLKGVAEPVPVHRVLRRTGVRSRLDLAAGRLTPFVGREVELATLVERWERAQEGEGQNVLVLGEAGVGKSRLAAQFREHLAAIPHTWLECGATPYTEATPFHPAIALISQGLGLAPGDTDAEKIGRIERGLLALASDEAVSLVADFLGLPPPVPLAMGPDVQRRKTMELLTEWSLAMSEAQPLVVLVEDLHWCDASSLELLGRMAAQSATARLLFIATARPEFTPPWPARENVTPLQLARLTKKQAREMATALGGADLPDATLDALVARAGGVPLYVEELTKSMAEPGAAQGVEAIPATLADSLMARLDRLSTAKEVAQRAAVLGREFSYPLLAAVAEMDEAALRAGLARLAEAEVLFARGEPPEATYTFKHALVQEAAYESLLLRARQQLHGRVVDVIGAKFPERAAAEPEVVARHAEAAGRIDEAIAHYQRAGEQGQSRSAYEEAIQHLHRAIALLATLPEGKEQDTREVALQLALGVSLAIARGFAHPECEAPYDRARVLCEALGDVRRLGLALIGLATFYTTRGEFERGRVLAARLIAAAEQRSDDELALRGHIQVGVVEYYQGKFASSLAHLETARGLYQSERDDATVSRLAGAPGVSMNYATFNLWTLGWPDRALARAREAIARASQIEHPFSLAFALFLETAVHWLRGDTTAQRARAAGLIALSEAQGFPLWIGVGKAFLGAARVASEPSAVAEIMEGLALAAETGNRIGASSLFALLAESYLIAGQPAEARGTVETGLALADQTGQPFYDAELHRLQGEIVLGTGGAPGDAEACFQRALEIARAQEARSFELRAATSLARLWRDQGKCAGARELLAPAYGWFTEGFETRDLVEARTLLDELSG